MRQPHGISLRTAVANRVPSTQGYRTASTERIRVAFPVVVHDSASAPSPRWSG
jgi:hypothetical protein